MNGYDGDRSQPDTTLIMLDRLLDGSLRGLAIYHLLKADLLMIRALPETASRPISKAAEGPSGSPGGLPEADQTHNRSRPLADEARIQERLATELTDLL